MKLSLIFYVLFLCSGISLSSFAAPPNAAASVLTYENLPVKVILFPYSEAVVSSIVDGVVKKYNFRPGESFKKGDVIARIDDFTYQEQCRRSDAQVAEEEKNCEFLKKLYDGNHKLFKQGMCSDAELDKNRRDWEVSMARLKSAKAEKKIMEYKLNSCQIIAPFSGRLEEQLVHEYEFVRNGQQMMKLLEDTRLLAVMYLPDSMRTHIKTGMVLKIKINQTGKVYQGKVCEIAARIDHRSHTFEVKMLVDNTRGELVAGMSGSLADKISSKTAAEK